MTALRLRWKVIATALAVVALSSIPYAIGWITQTEGHVFGGFVFDLDDSNSYLAVMQQGAQGAFRFTSLYTTESQRGAWVHTLYILLGHLVRLTGFPQLAVYHGARAACGLLLLLVADRFASLFLDQRDTRWTALLLVALSSGMGWFSEIFWPTPQGGISPLDFWLLDGYTFLGIMTFPHFALAWAALLLAFWAALTYTGNPRPGYLLAGGAAAFIATAVHPTLALVVGGVLALYGVVLWVAKRSFPTRWVVGGSAVAAGAGAMAVYLLLAVRADPVLAWYSRGAMSSPPPWYFLAGYGLLTPLALAGAIDLVRRRDRRGLFLIAWVVAAFALAYAPLSMQRRLIEGVHVPLSLLAALGLHRCVLPGVTRSRPVRAIARRGYPHRRVVWLVRSLLIVLTWLSNLYMVGAASLTAWARSPTLFHSADQLAAFDWLRDHTAWSDTSLASYSTGNLIPAWTGHRVFLGHWAESVDWPERMGQVEQFFDAATADTWRLAFLQQYNIAYVFHGPDECALGGFDPATASWLEIVFRQGDVAIYRVRGSP